MVYSFMSSVASSLIQLFCLADVRASLGTHLDSSPIVLHPPPVLVPLIFLNSPR